MKPAALRISLFYAGLMAPVGIQLPFMAIWFASRGIDAAELGIIAFATIVARVATSPLVGSWVDRRSDARAASLLFGWLTVFVFLPHLPAVGFWALLAAHVAYTVTRAPTGPIADALALGAAQREGLDFGRMRMWGSVSFLAVGVAAGPIIDRFGADAIAWLLLATLLAAALAAQLLPAAEAPATPRERPRAPVSELLRDRSFQLVLVASSLVQASHAVLYAYSGLGWRAAGLSQTEIGALWAIGTLAEILLLALGDRAIRRIAPRWLLLAAALACGPRWLLSGLVEGFWPLAALQASHALTFGLAYLGVMHWMAANLPASHAASAQTLNSSAISILLGLGMLGGGFVFAVDPIAAWLAMAAMGALGALAAAALALRERRAPEA